MNRPDPTQLYLALLNSSRTAELRRLTYRCAQARCLLLDAVETPAGILLHQKRYKYSREENLARSTDSGRAANTYDGDNHWRAQSYFIDESALSIPEDSTTAVEVICDHVIGHRLSATDFASDWQDKHSEVRIRADGSRYAL